MTMKWQESGGTEFAQAPVGTTIARCVKVIDIGTQKGEYQGQTTIKRQCIIGWELPNVLMGEGDHAGQPFVISKFYTASLSEKANLRKDLQLWRGKEFTSDELKGFDSANILGKTCMLSVIHNDKGKARVGGVMACPKGIEIPAQVNKSVYFSLEEFESHVFDQLSDGIKKMIIASPEYAEIIGKPRNNQGGVADMSDDIPFARWGSGGSWRAL
jgi:hypothetical protein